MASTQFKDKESPTGKSLVGDTVGALGGVASGAWVAGTFWSKASGFLGVGVAP